jgi:hypothetical protein
MIEITNGKNQKNGFVSGLIDKSIIFVKENKSEICIFITLNKK